MKLRLVHWTVTLTLAAFAIFLLLREGLFALSYERRAGRLAVKSYELSDAILDGNVRKVKTMISPGSDGAPPWMPVIMNSGQAARCFFPIHMAAEEGQLEILKALEPGRSDGSDIDARDEFGQTPIMWACEGIANWKGKESRIQCIQFLIAWGADLEARSSALRETALHLCARYGSLRGTQCLLELGANVNARSSEGNTPLHLACSRQYKVDDSLETAKLLLRSGALPDAKNKAGKKPLDLAMKELNRDSYSRFQAAFDEQAKASFKQVP